MGDSYMTLALSIQLRQCMHAADLSEKRIDVLEKQRSSNASQLPYGSAADRTRSLFSDSGLVLSNTKSKFESFATLDDLQSMVEALQVRFEKMLDAKLEPDTINVAVKRRLPTSKQCLALKERLGAFSLTVHEQYKSSRASLKRSKRALKRASLVQTWIENGGVQKNKAPTFSQRAVNSLSDGDAGRLDNCNLADDNSEGSESDEEVDLIGEASEGIAVSERKKSDDQYTSDASRPVDSADSNEHNLRTAVADSTNNLRKRALPNRPHKDWQPTSHRLIERIEELEKPPLNPLDVLDLSLSAVEQAYRKVDGLPKALKSIQQLQLDCRMSQDRTKHAFDTLLSECDEYITPHIRILEKNVADLNQLVPRVKRWENRASYLETELTQNPDEFEAKTAILVSNMKQLLDNVQTSASQFTELLEKGRVGDEKRRMELVRLSKLGMGQHRDEQAITVQGEVMKTDKMLQKLKFVEEAVKLWANERGNSNKPAIKGRFVSRASQLRQHVHEFISKVGNVTKFVGSSSSQEIKTSPQNSHRHFGRWVVGVNRQLLRNLQESSKGVREVTENLVNLAPIYRENLLKSYDYVEKSKRQAELKRTLALAPSSSIS